MHSTEVFNKKLEESEHAIASARGAYDSLTDEQKREVPAEPEPSKPSKPVKPGNWDEPIF